MLRTWRVFHKRFTNEPLSGEGTRRHGSRWTNPGYAVVFSAQSLSLALLEQLVHLDEPKSLKDYLYVEIDLRSDPEPLDVSVLPSEWRESPSSERVKEIGDSWVIEDRSLVLQVPSAVVPIEWNYLLNPAHVDFGSIQLNGPFELDLDPRLI